MDALRNTIKRVSHELSGREVVTVEEIKRIATTIALEFYDESKKVNFQEIIDGVVESFCEEPSTINSLHYPETFKLNEIEFRHVHTCSPTQELVGEAYEGYLRSKRLFESIDKMKEITDKFFSKYEINESLLRVYSKKKFRYGVFYTLIEDVERFLDIHKRVSERFDGEYVVVVPTENEVTPFLRFFRRNSERVKDAGFKIWVANTDQMSIDPFIGYPKDFTLLRGFKNPKVASQINSLWRERVDQLDEIE